MLVRLTAAWVLHPEELQATSGLATPICSNRSDFLDPKLQLFCEMQVRC